MLIHLCNFPYFKIIPNATASKINKIDVVATAPFAATFFTASPATVGTVKPLNVPATTSANAATTKIQNNQQNNKNNFFPNFPIYSSII